MQALPQQTIADNDVAASPKQENNDTGSIVAVADAGSLVTVNQLLNGRIDLAQENYNVDFEGVFQMRDKPRTYMGGLMFSLSKPCFLLTKATNCYLKIQESDYPREEDTLLIGDGQLSRVLNDMASFMTNVVKTKHMGLVGLTSFVYDVDKCYVKLSNNLRIYDSTKQPLPIPVPASFWTDVHYEAKFLIQVYGGYVYECQGMQRLKMSTRVVQMQIFDEAPYWTSYSGIMDICLM